MSTLENLTNEELLELNTWMNTLTRRQADAVINGYSTKFAYHVFRLALECEQILEEGDLDIERNREMLKSVRRGEWKLEQVREWFNKKESHLDDLYQKSELPHSPDEEAIKNLLLNAMEHHYGSLDKAIARDTDADKLVSEIQAVLDKYK